MGSLATDVVGVDADDDANDFFIAGFKFILLAGSLHLMLEEKISKMSSFSEYFLSLTLIYNFRVN